MKAHILFWLIGATDGHAKNCSVALLPGGCFAMTPLHDVLTVQPAFDAGQIQVNHMKLAMRVGKSRHDKVCEIQGWHFLETAQEAGYSREGRSAIRRYSRSSGRGLRDGIGCNAWMFSSGFVRFRETRLRSTHAVSERPTVSRGKG